MKKRLARLNEQLRRELSELIRTRVRDPRVGLVTITGVEVAADLG
ncbi:MAG TPA: ribosome-binding factor A, partial [Gemmatimonadetes bacterium]|nr:ribosome-binding factor A [Gemmatimonadota bacterium]